MARRNLGSAAAYAEAHHGASRRDAAPGRVRLGARAATEPQDRRSLEEANSPLEEDAAQPASEPCRLDVGGAGHEHAASRDRGPEPLGHLVRRELDVLLIRAEPSSRLGVVPPHAVLGRRRRDAEIPGSRVPGVHAVGFAPRADVADRPVRRTADRQRRVLPMELYERRQLVPQTVHEPAVATARAAAADVLLQQDDVDARIAVLQEVGRPHAGVAAAEDHDVGGRVRRERRTRLARIVRQRLFHPPSARRSRRRLERHGVHQVLPGIVRVPF